MRKALFWVHLIAGCAAGAVILIMAVTGVVLAYKRQITEWADGDFRVAPPAPGVPRLPMETVIANVLAQGRGKPVAVTLRAAAAAPVEVALGRDRAVFVNPYTGAVLGEAPRGIRIFFEDVESVHRWLGTSAGYRAAGRAVTGACNLAFLILVCSGPFLWWPRKFSWRSIRQIGMFRRGLSGRARDFNWHNVIGIWCAAPLAVIVVSGVVMSYPWANNLVYRLTGNPAGAQEDKGRARPAGPGGTVSAGSDALWLQAERQVPGWQSITLRFPASGRGPLTFSIDQGDGGRPDRRSQLTLDPRSGKIIRWEPFSSYNSGRRLRAWLRFLHTGEAGGFAGQTIAGLASAGAAFLVWTGVALAVRRFLRWRKGLTARPNEALQARSTNSGSRAAGAGVEQERPAAAPRSFEA
jgi:uncharacterized iron-regulated membrane protein